MKRMRQWVLDAEKMLDGIWNGREEYTRKRDSSADELCKQNRWCVTNEQVSLRFDSWRNELAQTLSTGVLSQKERECLEQFLQILANARPHLIQCYDLQGFPRTNNETEGSIRRVKARYRRISGRKNWNAYLLRHGRNIVFYEWWEQETQRWRHLEKMTQQLNPDLWRQMRKEAALAQSEQLKRFRFRHKRVSYLASLENCWAEASQSLLLP
jgi:hypothetical protein